MFVVYGKPVPSLAYYRDPDRQSRPTQVLFLKGAKLEASSSPCTLAFLSFRGKFHVFRLAMLHVHFERVCYDLQLLASRIIGHKMCHEGVSQQSIKNALSNVGKGAICLQRNKHSLGGALGGKGT